VNEWVGFASDWFNSSYKVDLVSSVNILSAINAIAYPFIHSPLQQHRLPRFRLPIHYPIVIIGPPAIMYFPSFCYLFGFLFPIYPLLAGYRFVVNAPSSSLVSSRSIRYSEGLVSFTVARRQSCPSTVY